MTLISVFNIFYFTLKYFLGEWLHIVPDGDVEPAIVRVDRVPPTPTSKCYIVPQLHDRVVRGPSWQYAHQDFDGSLPGQGTVTETHPRDQLVQVSWDNGSKNYYHVKMERRYAFLFSIDFSLLDCVFSMRISIVKKVVKIY